MTELDLEQLYGPFGEPNGWCWYCPHCRFSCGGWQAAVTADAIRHLRIQHLRIQHPEEQS